MTIIKAVLESKFFGKVLEVCKVTGSDWLVEVRVVVTETRRRGSCQASPRESATVMRFRLNFKLLSFKF